MNSTEKIVAEISEQPITPHLKDVLAQACERIPPLWPLKDFVAVNPFLGLSSRHFLQAATLLRHNAHGDILMPDDYYLNKMAEGEITDADVSSALEWAQKTLPSPWKGQLSASDCASLKEKLQKGPEKEPPSVTLTVADFLDQELETQWAAFVTEEISKWCSVYHDEGQSSWRMPWREQPFYGAWKEAARHDANPGLSGLKTLAQILPALPASPLAVIAHSLDALGIATHLQVDFLHRQLLTISGWSSYVQYKVRQNRLSSEEDQGLIELLAVRLAYDLALWEKYRDQSGLQKLWRKQIQETEKRNPEMRLLPRYLLQLALERNYQRKLALSLSSRSYPGSSLPRRAELQAVFCIDVRSEIYRRHLEAQNPGIQTSGFAGFFGMPIEYFPLGQEQGSSQCPVLLSPQYRIDECLKDGHAGNPANALRFQRLKQQVNTSWNSFKTSAVSCFNFVESAGLIFGFMLGRDTLALGGKVHSSCAKQTRTAPGFRPSCSQNRTTGIPEADQVTLAENALRNLGLLSNFPRLVLFCGHGSATKNNPYASGLDCGACGGHSGQVNARVAAGILNEPGVRKKLAGQGINIPADTHFLAGQHITTTDDVELFDLELVPASHREELQQVSQWLEEASRRTRLERSVRLGLKTDPKGKGSPEGLHDEIRSRSRDWSQVRPEWGLAGNAALIAAPRTRTRDLNLGGRTFLHDYESTRDPGGKVLELILVAPVIVANWINLQYFASTVNNPLFGSGNKTIHNVVGNLGIWQGNGGDLQTGLPLQSLHDGKSWMHEPLRLSVFIEAPAEKIEAILNQHNQVRQLIENQWFHLFRVDAKDCTVFQYLKPNLWIALA